MNIEVKFAGGRRFEAQIRGNKIAFDAQEKYGGADTAPEPPETFAASIGACLGMYAMGFLERRDLATDGFRIEINYEMAAEPSRIGSMHIKLHIPEAIPSKRRKQFMKIVRKCPLTGTLEVLPEMSLEVVEAGSSASS